MTDFAKNLSELETLSLDYEFRRIEITNYMMDKNKMFIAVNELHPKQGPFWVLTKHVEHPILSDEHYRVFCKECEKSSIYLTPEMFVERYKLFLKHLEHRSIRLEKVNHLGLTNLYTVEELKQWVINGD
jgi:hypothetical protein